MIKKTLGGDRLGSGNKMKAALHNYNRSTHDLGNAWRSTMAPGVLIPFYKKICTNGDTWSVNLRSLIKTMPAIGPCFGTFKLQMDMFEVPIRLYNGILHNNMTKIGMDMSKVKLPKIELTGKWQKGTTESYNKTSQVAPDSLVCYMGLRGIGSATTDTTVERSVQCVPILAYYDIFKNYYANKQEENAYVIDNEVTTPTDGRITSVYTYTDWGENWHLEENTQDGGTETYGGQTWQYINLKGYKPNPFGGENDTDENGWNPNLNLNMPRPIEINWKGNLQTDILLGVANIINGSIDDMIYISITQQYIEDGTGYNLYNLEWTKNKVIITPDWSIIRKYINSIGIVSDITNGNVYYVRVLYIPKAGKQTRAYLRPFKLENIDTMRINILRETALNTTFMLNDHDIYPYKSNWEVKEDGQSGCANPMQGLCVKTYQSDVLNCWLSKNWIDGVQGINEISAVAIEDGKFTIDALNLAHKVYNMLNRIAVSGGTYEDWQEAVYGEDALRRAESPIYCGGMSGLIGFEEVVSTADTSTAAAGDQPLGSLAGKGVLTNTKGGHIELHIKEPSYIIGIVSITPYVDYANGNDFDITEIESLNDLHKPELDEIGFQDLMLERAAWWAKQYNTDNDTWINPAGGKQPAWIEYMTSINQVYGNFAKLENKGWMVLQRDYEIGRGTTNNSSLDNSDGLVYTNIADWTTYINPTKYNYMFADTKLEAQNFDVQIGINAICRRKISAKLIPNL